jgi:hypothetical protein
MRQPHFTSIDVAAVKSGETYRPAVKLTWDLPGKDSLPVGQFVILHKKEASDSAFSVLHFGIPDTSAADWDVLSLSDFPAQAGYSKIWYRVFAVDTFGRAGDTSAIDSVILSWPPLIIFPEAEGALRDNTFKWSTILYRSGYYTYLFLWSDSPGVFWKSPRPAEPTYGHETPDSQSFTLPSPPAPLAAGDYYCGVKVEIPGAGIQSIAVRRFHVR